MSVIIFGKYELIRRLAVGGMGEIFLARQSGEARFERLVVIKTLLPDLARDQTFIKQFLEEARVAATLNHPNIVAVYEVGCWERVYFIAMEYIRGESVSGLLSATDEGSSFHIPYPITARIIHDAALALDHAHTAVGLAGSPLQIVHRDISPQNIMVREDGVTKVVDFGIARAADRSFRTRSGVVKGKLAYMAPEQISSELEVDHRTDQYALGVMLWEMCVGERLYRTRGGKADLLRLILHEPVPKPTWKRSDIPLELEEIALRMTQRQAQDRFASCAEVAVVLGAYMEARTADSDLAAVAAFVDEVAGAAVRERVSDLTPSPEPFLLSFEQGTLGTDGETIRLGPPTTGAREPGAREEPTRRRQWSRVAGGLLLIAALGAGAGGAYGVWKGYLPLPSVMDEAAPRAPVSEAKLLPRSEARADDVDQPATLALESEPSGATVRVGSELKGKTPIEIQNLEPGKAQRVVVELHGYETVDLPITLAPGKSERRKVSLERVAPRRIRKRTPPPEPSTPSREGNAEERSTVLPAKQEDGFLSVRTRPWTSVLVDGKNRGVTPLYKLRLTAGPHSILLVNEDRAVSEQREIVIPAGEVFTMDEDLTPNEGPE